MILNEALENYGQLMKIATLVLNCSCFESFHGCFLLLRSVQPSFALITTLWYHGTICPGFRFSLLRFFVGQIPIYLSCFDPIPLLGSPVCCLLATLGF